MQLFSADARFFLNLKLKLKKPPQKVAYLWQLGGFFLSSPNCQKQPRTSFPFYKFFYPIVSAKVSDQHCLPSSSVQSYRINIAKALWLWPEKQDTCPLLYSFTYLRILFHFIQFFVRSLAWFHDVYHNFSVFFKCVIHLEK